MPTYSRWFDDWHNLPATDTPVTAEALEHIEDGVETATDAVSALQTVVDSLPAGGSGGGVVYGTNVDASGLADGTLVAELPAGSI